MICTRRYFTLDFLLNKVHEASIRASGICGWTNGACPHPCMASAEVRTVIFALRPSLHLAQFLPHYSHLPSPFLFGFFSRWSLLWWVSSLHMNSIPQLTLTHFPVLTPRNFHSAQYFIPRHIYHIYKVCYSVLHVLFYAHIPQCSSLASGNRGACVRVLSAVPAHSPP